MRPMPKYVTLVDLRSARCLRHTTVVWPECCWTHPTTSILTDGRAPIISKCMTDDEFQLQVEAFIARHGLSPTTFGLWAMNDSRFVFDLRNGRACFVKTMRRVYQFMAEYERKQEAKRLRSALGG